MKPVDIKQLQDKQVRLYLPEQREEPYIRFRLGENELGCVHQGTIRHYDYVSLGTFFELRELYKESFVDSIKWRDYGIFTVTHTGYFDAGLELTNEQGETYKIVTIYPEDEYPYAEEQLSFPMQSTLKPLI